MIDENFMEKVVLHYETSNRSQNNYINGLAELEAHNATFRSEKCKSHIQDRASSIAPGTIV